MTFSVLIKQPWFQILAAVVVVILIGTGIYFYGKSAGRAEARTEFDVQQESLLKKSQEAELRADKWQAQGEAAVLYAERLKAELADDRKVATATEKRIEEDYLDRQQEIEAKYEQNKTALASMSSCDLCRDLCRRSNALVALGPEFAGAACDESKQCAGACADPNAGPDGPSGFARPGPAGSDPGSFGDR